MCLPFAHGGQQSIFSMKIAKQLRTCAAPTVQWGGVLWGQACRRCPAASRPGLTLQAAQWTSGHLLTSITQILRGTSVWVTLQAPGAQRAPPRQTTGSNCSTACAAEPSSTGRVCAVQRVGVAEENDRQYHAACHAWDLSLPAALPCRRMPTTRCRSPWCWPWSRRPRASRWCTGSGRRCTVACPARPTAL